NVGITMVSLTGFAGSGAAWTNTAAAGNIVYNNGINNNGGRLTVDGAFNTTINGVLSGAGGLTKDWAGALKIGTGAAHTFSGSPILTRVLTIACNANVTGGTSALTLNGGSFNSGGFNQAFGTLTLSADSTLDLDGGASAVTFANSSAISWTGTLHIL